MKPQRKELSCALEHRLATYALAASAAGVSVLALAQSAESKIVYTPDDRAITKPSNDHRVWLTYDLLHHGIADFTLNWHVGPANSYLSTFLRMLGGAYNKRNDRNRVEAWLSCCGTVAAALPAGSYISQHALWKRTRGTLIGTWGPCGFICSTHTDGQWRNDPDAYLGLKFKVNGKSHYGWVRLHIEGNVVHSKGYAYETIPNKPIIAGKTHGKNEAMLGRLAQGASGVAQEKK